MNQMIHSKTIRSALGTLCVCAMLASAPSCSSTSRTGEDRTNFDSPEAAVDAAILALRADDVGRLSAILGPESASLVNSGDAVADKAGRKRFLTEFDSKHTLVKKGDDTAVLEIGTEGWPFPIPIVRGSESWFFDTEEGEEELIDRRIGRNELSVIQISLAFVDAQEEYARRDWDGDGLFEYAQRFRSTPNKKDGLYWASTSGEEESPLGELAAQAAAGGYDVDRATDDRRPFHGYNFKILNCQGKSATGGAYSYMAGNSMIGGCALIAWPASYEDSGIMCFLVSHDGIVYQKDLGAKSESVASKMTTFAPDRSWTKAGKR